MNLGAVLLESGAPGAPALLEGDHILTYAELRTRALAVAGAIAASTPERAVVAIEAPNSIEFVVAYLATLLAGRIAAPLNPSAPANELARERAAVAAARALDQATVRELAGAGAGSPLREPAATAPGDPAVLLFTSGTAGAPRAATLTHANLLANLDQVQAVPRLAVRADDVALGALPMFHVYGLNVVLGLTLRAGASVVVVERFDPTATLYAIAQHRVTMLSGVPTMFRAWAEQGAEQSSALRATVRLAVSGAAALAPQTAHAFAERFGVDVYEGYGLTEASPIVTTTAVERTVRAGSIGPPLPGVDVRLVDEDGSDALVGDPGEIWVRGPNVFAGYWNDPEQTARVLDRDGWLHTGDVAVADDDGWLTLVDRTKDLINVSGFNVYPAEVEDALVTHPGIADAGVVGEHDEHRGEHVVAFVVARDPSSPPTSTQLVSHLRGELARYKIPSRFEVVDALPRSDTGKLLRRELAERANRT